MPQINPYLSFDGDCAEAFRFYEKTLQAQSMKLFSYGESRMADRVDPSARDTILHACLTLESGSLMGADRFRIPWMVNYPKKCQGEGRQDAAPTHDQAAPLVR